MKPLKILFVTTYFHPDKFGGAERVVHELARSLATAGQEVTVLTHRAAGTAQQEWLSGFRVIRYHASTGRSLAFYTSVYRNVRKAVKELTAREEAPYDILHTHQPLAAYGVFFPKPLMAGRTVSSFYAPYFQEFESKHLAGRPAAESASGLPWRTALLSKLLRRAEAYMLKRSPAVIVLSRFSLSQVEALLGKRPDNVAVIPAGVDLDRFHPDEVPVEIKTGMGIPRGVHLLFSVRRLVERMGLEDLIDAAGILAERSVPFHLAVGGEGPLRLALERRAAASPAADRIRFLGRLAEEALAKWYAACDLFVLPSRSLEGFGMVTLEAMASGVPVVGTGAGATPEILEALDPGLVVRERGPDALAERLAALLGEPGRLIELGRRAREIVEKEYPWKEAAEKTLAVYRRVIEGRGP